MTSNAREKVYNVLEIVLRVPPIFLMDSILYKGLPYELANEIHDTRIYHSNMNASITPDDFNGSMQNTYKFVTSITLDLNTLTSLLLSAAGFLFGVIIFMLSREHLFQVYRWVAAIGTVLASYCVNLYYIDLKTFYWFEESSRFLIHVIFQLILTMIFCIMHRQYRREGLFILMAFILPSFINLSILLPIHLVRHSPMASTLIVLTYVTICCLLKLPRIFSEMINAVRVTRIFLRYYGLHALLENEWTRLNVPHVLRVFWLTRVSEDIISLVAKKIQPSTSLIDFSDVINVSLSSVFSLAKDVLVRGCDTVLAVLGMTSMVASFAHYFGFLVQQFLMTDDDEEKSIGTVSAVLFFVLALQTGLTGLDIEKRFIRLYRNFCLLFTAILHFVHNIVNPLLMSLSASRNRSVQRHSRVLIVCVFLIAFPCWFLYYLWTNHSLSTWMLAVSAFTIEVVIKVIISLLLYFLFMLDAYRNCFWEKLDDYIYYIRAVGNTIEFIFGIFLFFNGAWILLFESGGAIRACMMCIHAYINIWLQAKSGWRTFIKRRTAVNKINSLPEATEEQLQGFDDVCAICYQELTNARITKCNHYFHGVCLRKWLYVQDRCPLCHKTLYKFESEVEEVSEHGEDDVNIRNEEVDEIEVFEDIEDEVADELAVGIRLNAVAQPGETGTVLRQRRINEGDD